jgi:phenylalanyl-tRNA synthetase beta chain
MYETAVAELSLDLLLQCVSAPHMFHAHSDFPSAYRDIACIVDESVMCESVVKAMSRVSSEIVSVEIIDMYRTADMRGEHKKSLTLRFVYQSETHTLSGEEVETAHNKARVALQQEYGAVIR